MFVGLITSTAIKLNAIRKRVQSEIHFGQIDAQFILFIIQSRASIHYSLNLPVQYMVFNQTDYQSAML